MIVRSSEFSDNVTNFKTKMNKNRNAKDDALLALLRIVMIMGGEAGGRSFIKKFPSNVINNCRWITSTNRDVLNLKMLIMKIDERGADIKVRKTRMLMRLTLYLVGLIL